MVTREFIAQRYLTVPDPESPEGDVHSHRFTVEVEFVADSLGEYGYLVNITEVEALLAVDASDAVVHPRTEGIPTTSGTSCAACSGSSRNRSPWRRRRRSNAGCRRDTTSSPTADSRTSATDTTSCTERRSRSPAGAAPRVDDARVSGLGDGSVVARAFRVRSPIPPGPPRGRPVPADATASPGSNAATRRTGRRISPD